MEKKVLIDNSSGVVRVVFGILSIISSIVPFLGIAFGIISLVFGIVQKKKPTHGWGKIAVILSVIGIILSLVIWIVAATILTKYLGQVYSQNGIN